MCSQVQEELRRTVKEKTMPDNGYKYYSVYDRKTDMPIIIHASALECCAMLNITVSTFYCYVSHSNTGYRKGKYEIFVDDKEDE